MKISLVLVCGGNGSRSKLAFNKVLFPLDGKTVFEKSLCTFLNCGISEVIVPVPQADLEKFEQICKNYPCVTLVLGGATRTMSVKNALEKVTGDIVLIHDGARPFVSKEIIERAISCVKQNASAITAVPSVDTLAVAQNDIIDSTVRDGYFRIQTPQGFFTKDIKNAYSKITQDDVFTDDSAVYSAFIGKCHLCLGEESNIKLTYPEDFEKLNAYRVGTGFDLHRLVEGRKLILGGIEIPHTKGLLGHSDADVLVHAIMDAMLSACCLRDIGYHFPDTDPQYKGISSILLLEKVLKLVEDQGYKVSNISACIMAEKPKLMKFVPEITKNLAEVIHISTNDLGITCTTLEGIGTVGREEGIAVSCNLLLKKI